MPSYARVFAIGSGDLIPTPSSQRTVILRPHPRDGMLGIYEMSLRYATGPIGSRIATRLNTRVQQYIRVKECVYRSAMAFISVTSGVASSVAFHHPSCSRQLGWAQGTTAVLCSYNTTCCQQESEKRCAMHALYLCLVAAICTPGHRRIPDRCRRTYNFTTTVDTKILLQRSCVPGWFEKPPWSRLSAILQGQRKGPRIPMYLTVIQMCNVQDLHFRRLTA